MSKTAIKNSKGLKSYKELNFDKLENMQGLNMTSFELFRLLKFKNFCILHIFLYFIFLKYIMCDNLHHFMKKNQIFCIKFW